MRKELLFPGQYSTRVDWQQVAVPPAMQYTQAVKIPLPGSIAIYGPSGRVPRCCMLVRLNSGRTRQNRVVFLRRLSAFFLKIRQKSLKFRIISQ